MNYNRKRRQFKHLSKTINRMMQTQKWESMDDGSKSKLTLRLNKLYRTLRFSNSEKSLRKVLASAAILIAGSSIAQTFAPGVTLPFGMASDTNEYMIPRTVDIDDDGDIDLFGSFAYGTNFFQNTGTANSAAFAAPAFNAFNLQAPGSQIMFCDFADLDGDGDLDIYGSSYYSYTAVNFYENTGSNTLPNFSIPTTNPHGIDTDSLQFFSPTIEDMDNDGDLDIMAGSYYGDITYFENTGTPTSPAFGTGTTNPFGINGISGVAFTSPDLVDFDNDGDLDLFVGTYSSGNILYMENTGTASAPAFGTAQTNPFGLAAAVSGYAFLSLDDMDGDGDIDLFVGEYGAGTSPNLYYYENLETSVGVENPSALDVSVFPNPANDQLNINIGSTNGTTNIQLVDAVGKTILSSRFNETNNVLNISDLPTGIYIMTIENDLGSAVEKIIKK